MKAPLRVLHLEDSRRDAELIQSILKAAGLECDVVHVKNQPQFESAVARDSFDIILADYTIPDYNGFSALDYARRKAPAVPFILISGTLGEELAVECLQTGATDYILKQRLNRLVPAVKRAVHEAKQRAEKQRAEEALERVSRYNQLILQSTADGIYGLDFNGTTTFVNPSAAAMLGYTVEELLGQPAVAFLRHTHRDGSPCLQNDCPIYAAYRRGEPRQVEDQLFWRKDGASFPAQYVCNPIWTEQSQLAGAVVTFRDITGRRRLEDQVRQSQKMEAIGQLAGGIAHDFNNILGCIVGYSELALLEAANTRAVEENLEEVLKASQRAKELVLQILTFSRQQEQERKPIRLQSVIKEALKLLRASLPSTIQIRADVSAELPTVLADATQIHQIVMNLATNAAHAMAGRPGELGLTLVAKDITPAFAAAHPDLRAGPYVALSVSDTGCGMDQATLSRIFEPFFTTKPAGEGTGLGLAVVHGIVKSHDGAITVESAPGKGTTFCLYFPAHGTDATEAALNAAGIARGKGQRVLFVDDEAPLAFLGKKLLERAGYTVTVQTNPVDALAAFRAQPDAYDLVVTDLTMPQITGADLATEFLALRSDIPIILTTGFTGAMNSEKAHALGVRELLVKPLTLQSLAEAAHSALQQ